MRNIILIVVDTLRADHLGCYGYGRPTSPFLDSLAEKSLVLDSCYSASNFTAPAFTSLFTASYPSRHGILDFCSQATSSPIRTCLEANDVRAEGIVAFRFFNNVLARIWGEVEVVTDTRSFDFSKDLPRAVSDGAIEWLEQYGKKGPFFLFLHYDGPHIPYRLPDQYAEMFDTVDPNAVDPEISTAFFPQHLERMDGSAANNPRIRHMRKLINAMNTRRRRVDPQTRNWVIDKYDATIRYTDDMISRVYEALQALDLSKDTLFAVLSDHGEELWDHGLFGHGEAHMYDEIIRTVGIIHDPAKPGRERTSLPTSHVQIIPSLLKMAGAVQLSEFLSALDIREAEKRLVSGGPPEPVFCIGPFKSVVRLANMKWIHTRPSRQNPPLKRLKSILRLIWTGQLKDELFDLSVDPEEKVNINRERSRSRPLADLLKQHFKEAEVESPAGESAPCLDDSERKKIEKELRDLGYM
jgi:arylsulfatase A-like enzyme